VENLGKVDKQDSDRSSTENWKGIVYLAFSRNGIPPSELDNLEWDVYFGMLDEFEEESKKISSASKGISKPPPPLKGETEKDRIMSMRKDSIKTIRK